jgi:cysteine desulfurase family protein (TIGR01976 family)
VRERRSPPAGIGSVRSVTDAYDIARIRSLFPALSTGAAYLDGAAGTQTPTSVIEAIAAAYAGGMSNTGGAFASSRRSEEIEDAARAAVADLVGGDAGGVVFGPNMTTLTFRFADAFAADWADGDNIVLTRLDHDADVRPWVRAAARAGVQVRWADPVLPSLELPAATVGALIDERTRLVAVTAASNVVGTRPPVAQIAALAHGVGAVVYVDGVHATPHGPTDVATLGADLYLTSAYKWAGPHIGIAIGRPELLERLRPAKLASSADTVPDRFEWGTPAFADLAGVTAAVEHLAALAPDPTATTRRARVLSSMDAVRAHEERLFSRLLDGLAAVSGVRLIGGAPDRTPTAWFTVEGHTPLAVAEHCAAAGVNVWNGHNYAWELAGLLGIRDAGSAVRAGIVHYNDDSDVDRLLEAVAML